MSGRMFTGATVFAGLSFAIAMFMTGLGKPASSGPRLAAAGSPVNMPVLIGVGVLLVAGTTLFILGRRRDKGE